MAKIYERVNWENLPSKNTPINAENLNKMDEAIDKLDDKIVELEESSGGGSGDYLEKENPSGTGSFSMNRKAGTTVGNYSTAIGYDCEVSGAASFANGESCKVSNSYSFANGQECIVSGSNSGAVGFKCQVSGNRSFAEGNLCIVGGGNSHAEGHYCIANGENQHVQGKYNVEDNNNKYAHIVGGGKAAYDRKNIHTLDWEGNAVFAGDVSNGNGVTLDGLKELVEEKTNIDDDTPTYTEAEELAELTSGEKLSTAFGKLAKAVKDLISHLADKVVHITSDERTNWNDANTKKHTHSNKSVLDGITSTLITAWNSAVTHITDAVKHITSDERTLWNTVSNKADSNHTHNYAGSSSAGGAANSAKTLYHTRYIDGIPFDGSSNLSRLGTCTTATYMADKEVTISAFDDEGAQDAILYIQFTATYEGALNDAHAISINGGEPLTIYYKGEVFNWETYFSNYPFCDGQIHQFRYFWSPTGSYLELITPSNRAVANNLTTTDEKIALAAPMGKQLAETDASLQEQISTLNSNYINASCDADVTTEETFVKTVYTATEFCEVSVSAAHRWGYTQPAFIKLLHKQSDGASGIGATSIYNDVRVNEVISASGVFIMQPGNRIDLYVKGNGSGINHVDIRLVIRKL